MPDIQEEVARFSAAVKQYLLDAEVGCGRAKETVVKYRDCLHQIEKALGDFDMRQFSKQHVLEIKKRMLARNNGLNRQIGILLVLKYFLRFVREELKIETLEPESVLIPKRKYPPVQFLTPEEFDRFVGSIKLNSASGNTYLPGLRFRALVEALLGTAVRISELLSLNRSDIDFEKAEARVVGKGSKERIVFFTDRALDWIKRYLDTRSDDCPALFVTLGGKGRLTRTDIWRPFARHKKRAGIQKKLTPHILRHTTATQLLFNGCPMSHIKEILGHARLETTCRHYIGLDHRAAKAAHRKYLTYSTTDA